MSSSLRCRATWKCGLSRLWFAAWRFQSATVGLQPNVWKFAICGILFALEIVPDSHHQTPHVLQGLRFHSISDLRLASSLVGHQQLVGDVSCAQEGEQTSPAAEAREDHRCRFERVLGWQCSKMLLGRPTRRTHMAGHMETLTISPTRRSTRWMQPVQKWSQGSQAHTGRGLDCG